MATGGQVKKEPVEPGVKETKLESKEDFRGGQRTKVEDTTPVTSRTTDKRVYTIKHQNTSVKFECDARYTPIESIGTGAYGVVCAAKDNRTGRKVAIKKISNTFDVLTVAKRTYRELKILRHLRHDNIISILDIMEAPEEESSFQDVYVVLDLMESDLHHIIHSVQPLSDDHVKFLLYQVARGLKYIHSAKILHRDLKPSNLLINRNCELKIGDFGMARGLSSTQEEHVTFMTEYVATRWYRAPELMLSLNEYTSAIDMWSVGCIFAEMLGRRQMFPGKNYLNQLQLILSVVGTPTEEYVRSVGSEKVRTYLKTLPQRKPVNLEVIFPNASSQAIELLTKLLQLDPKERCMAEDALAHPYLSQYHDPPDEPVCSPPFDFTFERKLVTKESLKKALQEEIKIYHKSRLPIPRTDQVRDALKRMMEQREKSGETEAEKEKREAVKKKKVEDRKRKHPDHGDKSRKKHKAYSPLTSNEAVLEHWNRIQQSNINRRLGRGPAEEVLKQQELLIRQQAEELDKQQQQLAEQQQHIQQQTDQIRMLIHQQKILIRQCKASGIKLPLRTPDPSPLTTPSSPALTPSGTKMVNSAHSPSTTPTTTLTLPNSTLSHLSYSSSCRHSPSYQQPTLSCSSMVSLAASLLTVTSDNSTTITSYPPPLYNMGGSTHDYVPYPSVDPSMSQYMMPTQPPTHEFMQPLTSKDLTELTSREVRKLSPYDPNSVGSFVPPLPEEFDNILDIDLPLVGSGAGYGVGINDEDLHLTIPPDHNDEGPPSAHLLEDWLDLSHLDPQGMEALQRDMEFGASDMFFRQLDKL